MKYSHIIWDVDGTLLHTQQGVLQAVKYVLQKHSYPTLSFEDEQKVLATPKIQDAFKNYCNIDNETALIYADEYREIYKTKFLFEAEPYHNIINVLQILSDHDCRQAIVTNKRHDYATLICQHFGLDKFCDFVYGAGISNTTKKSEIIQLCMRQWNVHNSSGVMIGDTDGDKNAAQEADINFIGVNYGYGFKNIIDYVNKPTDILQKLEIIN